MRNTVSKNDTELLSSLDDDSFCEILTKMADPSTEGPITIAILEEAIKRIKSS